MADEAQTWHLEWGAIDRAADPSWFVRFLDLTRAGAIRAARADPAAFFAPLELTAGHRVLDVGCGTGELVAAMATVVGETGRAVGVDYSKFMVEEARKRAGTSRAEYVQGDAQNLPFEDASFDRVQANAVFQHLADRPRALRELMRVVRPGGKILVAEQDWDTFVIDGEPQRTSRALVRFLSEMLPDGGIAHRLPRLFRESGLTDVTIAAQPVIFRDGTPFDFSAFDRAFDVSALAKRGAAAGAITTAEGDAWLESLRSHAAQGSFLAAFTSYATSGRKPEP